jgi:hypothetical protein
MSKPKHSGFNPTPMMSIDDVERIGTFFKRLLADSPAIKWSIIAAGIAGVLESIHILWLALRYIKGF